MLSPFNTHSSNVILRIFSDHQKQIDNLVIFIDIELRQQTTYKWELPFCEFLQHICRNARTSKTHERRRWI